MKSPTIVIAVLGCLVTPVAASQQELQPSKAAELVYEPQSSVLGAMTVLQAERIVREFFVADYFKEVRLEGDDLVLIGGRSNRVAASSRFKEWRKEIRLKLSDIKPKVYINSKRSGIMAPPFRFFIVLTPELMLRESRVVEEYKQVANALFTIGQSNSVALSPAYQLRFDEALRTYRSAAIKPPVPDQARRALVQGRALVNENDFGGAAGVYEAAVDAVPWWADGHYNLAFVLSKIDRYAEAITEMNRYLALAPGDPDVQVAQDLIYEWELRAKKAAEATKAAPAQEQGGRAR